VLLKTLHALGFAGIAVATDGAQAVNMLLEAPKAYDLILMDINMPVMDGHEATVRIRESGNTVPIVAMTAHALKGHIEQCLEKGMDDYIPKPMDRRRVIRTLLRWLPHNDDSATGKKAKTDTTTEGSVACDASGADKAREGSKPGGVGKLGGASEPGEAGEPGEASKLEEASTQDEASKLTEASKLSEASEPSQANKPSADVETTEPTR